MIMNDCDKIDPIKLGVITSIIMLIGSFLSFIIAITLFNQKSVDKNEIAEDIRGLQEHMRLLQRKL